MADIWWNTAEEVLEKDIYDRMYKMSSLGVDAKRVVGIIKKCMENETVLIVGYSNHGIYVRNALLKCGVIADILFCDNNSRKRKLKLTEQKIYSVEEAAKKYKKALWVNVVQKQRAEIIDQLQKLGISNEQIVNYYCE